MASPPAAHAPRSVAQPSIAPNTVTEALKALKRPPSRPPASKAPSKKVVQPPVSVSNTAQQSSAPQMNGSAVPPPQASKSAPVTIERDTPITPNQPNGRLMNTAAQAPQIVGQSPQASPSASQTAGAGPSNAVSAAAAPKPKKVLSLYIPSLVSSLISLVSMTEEPGFWGSIQSLDVCPCWRDGQQACRRSCFDHTAAIQPCHLAAADDPARCDLASTIWLDIPISPSACTATGCRSQ